MARVRHLTATILLCSLHPVSSTHAQPLDQESRGAIVLKRSTDGGRTWSERLPTPGSFETSKETPTLHRVVDVKGKRRLILFSGLYPIRMSVSEDDGQSFSELVPIGE